MAIEQAMSKLIVLCLLVCISIQLIASTSQWQVVASNDNHRHYNKDDPTSSGFITLLEHRNPIGSIYNILIASSKKHFALLEFKLDQDNGCMLLESVITERPGNVQIYDNAGRKVLDETRSSLNRTLTNKLDSQLEKIVSNYQNLKALESCSEPIPLVESISSSLYRLPTACQQLNSKKPQGRNKDIYCFNSCKRIQQVYSDSVGTKEDSTNSVLWRQSDGLIAYSSDKINDNRRFIFGEKVVRLNRMGEISFSANLDHADRAIKESEFITINSEDKRRFCQNLI